MLLCSYMLMSLSEISLALFPMTPGSTMNSPQAIFTSFKLPKPSLTTVPSGNIFGNQLLTSTPEHLNMVASSPSSPDESPKSLTP
ncbi:unnamed protein product, partial [Timema podura]|nr:unnamed protein product [Timema podura]